MQQQELQLRKQCQGVKLNPLMYAALYSELAPLLLLLLFLLRAVINCIIPFHQERKSLLRVPFRKTKTPEVDSVNAVKRSLKGREPSFIGTHQLLRHVASHSSWDKTIFLTFLRRCDSVYSMKLNLYSGTEDHWRSLNTSTEDPAATTLIR